MAENAVNAEPAGYLEACEEALHECQHCAAECVKEGMVDCALLCLDCADACGAALSVMARESAHHGDSCTLCVHLREACAAECEKHAGKHGHWRQRAEVCRQCASELQQARDRSPRLTSAGVSSSAR